jgi:hypothetical protein
LFPTEASVGRYPKGSSPALRWVRIALLLLLAIVTIFTLITIESLNINGGCGDDGLHYCRMSQGNEVTGHFYARRMLLPFLVRLIGGGRRGFLFFNVLALIALCALTGMMTERRGGDGWIAGALLALMPFGLRWTLYNPVTVDMVATALAVAWFVFPSWGRSLLGLAAVLTREVWFPVIAVVAIIQRDWKSAIAASVGALLAIKVGGGLGPSPIGPIKYFLTWQGIEEYGWMALFSLGLLPLLLLRRTFQRADRQVLLIVFILAATATFAYDVHRYLFASAPFLLALVVPVANRRLLEFSVLAIGSLLEWRLFHVLHGTRDAYFSFFSPLYGSFLKRGTLLLDIPRLNGRVVADLLLVAAPLVVWLLLIVRGGRNHATSELLVSAH